ncbi:MAG TPA: carbon monoxide dehydrogenase subunit G [Burkholderiaceae bacterium]|nr:carbon monoxide dehydrogenase subunit G [Burkholderiaceae bacterium]
MELKGERTLAAGRDTAWKALNDIEVLKRCVPGCESITPTGENKYEVAMTAAVGPVKSRFKGKMEVADIQAPNAYTLKFDGSGGAAGFARGEAKVELSEVSARETRLVYVANAQVGGKLAQVGSRLIDAASGAMADKFFEAFAGQLAAQAAPVVAGAPPPPPPPQATIGFWSLFLAFLKRLFGKR